MSQDKTDSDIKRQSDGLQKVTVGGVVFILLPQRALLWQERKILIVADIHFGKAAAFRAGGVPVPHGTTAHNLAMLDALISAYDIAHIIFLGDFLHAKTARAPTTLQALQNWREAHASMTLTLVRGNHDRHAGDPPDALNMAVVEEPFLLEQLALCHHPQQVGGAYALAGHTHPVIRLAAGSESLRLPCFVFGPRQATLPAFGAFTGGHVIEAGAEERIFICTDDKVFFYPTQAP